MSISPIEDNQPEALAKKQSELLVEKDVKDTLQVPEPEITRTQLSLRRRLELAHTAAACGRDHRNCLFVQKSHIDPQKTWAAISSANVALLLAAFVVYYLSFPLRALRWRLLLQNVGFTRAQWRRTATFLETGGNHLHFLFRERYCASQIG